MSESGGLTRLYVTVLVFSLLMPVISFSLTSWEVDVEDYEISIDPDVLMIAGISLSDGITLNVSWKSDYVYYEFPNKTIRTKWTDTWTRIGVLGGIVDMGDGLAFETQTATNKFLNNWWLPYKYRMRPESESSWDYIAHNLTIESNFNPKYNYSRFILEDGYQIFFTPYNPNENLSTALYDTGHLNCTIGISVVESGAGFNFGQFMTWYWSIIVGSSSYGLPTFLSWIVRIISALTLLSGILLARELIG